MLIERPVDFANGFRMRCEACRASNWLTSEDSPAGSPVAGDAAPTVLDRFTTRKEPMRLTLVEPIVVEVSADVAWSGRSFRHPVRYFRARPELDPASVAAPQHLHRG